MSNSKVIEARVTVVPRTKGTARVREVWDFRLRQSERERILELAGVSEHRLFEAAQLKWSEFDEVRQAQILIGLRDLVTLGNEAAYALGYSRRNG